MKKQYRIVIAEDHTILREGIAVTALFSPFYINVKTMEKHRANLMKRLDLHSTSALTAFAMEKGLITK